MSLSRGSLRVDLVMRDVVLGTVSTAFPERNPEAVPVGRRAVE